MKYLGIIFIITLFLGCNQDRITIQFNDDKSISDEYGIPRDSSSYYFPKYSFDSIKNKYSGKWKLNVRSYMLYKMKEPILSNFYLGREIYRLTVLRAFHKPIVINIDNYSDSLKISVKKLNKDILYPFIVYDTSSNLTYNGIPILTKQSEKDSLNKLYNNTNYFIDFKSKKTMSKSEWDSLNVLIDSTKIWYTTPDLAQNYVQIDGSNWIIEAHNKYGYQIKVIPSPNFDRNYKYENNFDKKNHYRNLFEFIMKISELKNERLY